MQGQARYQRSGKIVPEAYASLQDIIMKYGCFRLCDACGSEAAHRVVIRLAYAQIKHTGDPVTDLQNMIQWCQDRAMFDAVHALTLPLAPERRVQPAACSSRGTSLRDVFAVSLAPVSRTPHSTTPHHLTHTLTHTPHAAQWTTHSHTNASLPTRSPHALGASMACARHADPYRCRVSACNLGGTVAGYSARSQRPRR